jgi:hypothetical protein
MRKINHRFNHLSKWLFAGAVTIIALLTVFIGGPSNASAAPFNLNNMRWGLLPATDPKSAFWPTYSAFDVAGTTSETDWNPSPNGSKNIGSSGTNAATLQNPYIVGTDNPKLVVGKQDFETFSDAKIGDTIQQFHGDQFVVTGFRLGADEGLMGNAGANYTYHGNLRDESNYFNFQVQEVDKNDNPVSGSGLSVYSTSGYQYSTILGFDKMAHPNDDLAKVTITPLNNDNGKLFTGSQTLYFALKGSPNPPVVKPNPSNFGYGVYDPTGQIGMTSMKPNTVQDPITLTTPSNGELYLSDLNNSDATWKSDNSSLKVTSASNKLGYQVTGLNSLTPGTVVKFTITQNDGTTSDFYFKFNNGNSTGGGSSSSGTAATPTIPETGNSTTNSSLSSSTPATSSSSTTTTVPSTSPSETGNVEVKGGVIYATKKIALYKSVSFTKANRIAWYPKQKRINRPMFVVTGYARSANGTLRYQVRDVNHGHKTAGKTGYVTASRKYVIPVYYASLPKSKKITVISKKGIYAYKSVKLTGKSKHYKKGIRLTVKKLVKHNLTTRYQLSNGWYATTNKKLVIGSD